MKFLLPVFAAALLAVTSQAATKKVVTLPPMPATPPGSSAILLGTDTVQKELKLTSLQRAVIDDIRSEYRDAARDISAKVAAGQQTKKQGLANIQALTAGSDRRALRVLNDDQKKRLDEIRYQLVGGYMLLQPKLQADLALTDKQKAKIKKIWERGETYASKVNTWFEDGKISFYERLLYLRENRTDRSDDFLAVLTSEQYTKFTAYEGEGFAHE
jgi:Spy/CpxP family protein refolding chaperone